MWLALLLILATLLNISACGMQESTVEKSDADPENKTSLKQSDGQKDFSEIQAINLMQDIESGSVDGLAPNETFMDAQLDFALSLFQGTVASGETENMLISPLSVMLALAMTANGAQGDTRAEMETLLGGDLTLEQLNAYLLGYVDSLSSGNAYKLRLANSIWFRDDESTLTVSPDFLKTNADYYGASAYKSPFDEQTVKDINNWTNQNTDGMIDRIMDEIDPITMMFLINAIAFDAEWAAPVYNTNIERCDFTSADGTVGKVDMMYTKENEYISDASATGFIKPYKGKYSFVALLPNEGIDIYEYIAGLTPDALRETLNNAEHADVVAGLPKFSYEYSVTMNDLLSDMGMPAAFDGGKADFSGIGQTSNGGLCLGSVLHKTFIDVSEEGTRAAAVTNSAPTVKGPSDTLDDPRYVILDRPFVYLIIDTATNLPIFMGTLMNPNQ